MQPVHGKPAMQRSPPGWQIRYFGDGLVVYRLRETYYESAFQYYREHTGVEDNTDTREDVLIGLAKGLYYIEVSGNA